MSKMNRREFLNRLAKMSLATTTYASMSKMLLTSQANAALGDYRALVNIFLHGGNDSYNMIVPTSNAQYQDYTNARQDLSVPQADLLTLDGTAANGVAYGIHPVMPEMQQIFNSGRASVLHNVGALVTPVTKDEYKNKSVLTPQRLFSHNDQQDFWQADDETKITGWAGRIADVLNTANVNQTLSMNISLGGYNLWQSGRTSTLYPLSKDGVAKLSGLQFDGGTGNDSERGAAFKAILDLPSDHLFVQEFANVQNNSILLAELLSELLASVPEPVVQFPANNSLGDQLKMAGKLISLRDTLQVSRQIFLVTMGDWDTHSSQLNNHPGLLSKVSRRWLRLTLILRNLVWSMMSPLLLLQNSVEHSQAMVMAVIMAGEVIKLSWVVPLTAANTSVRHQS